MTKSAPAPIYRAITAVIRGEEAAQKMERSELSARTGIPVRSLHTYLSDEREMKIGQLEAIAKALGFDDLTELAARAYKRLEKSERGDT